MKLAKVIGNVVATRKEEKVRGRKFMVIQPVNLDLEPTGDVLVGVDAVGLGSGELILYATGSSARQTHLTENRPTDCVIMAIVDLVEVEGENKYNKSKENGAPTKNEENQEETTGVSEDNSGEDSSEDE
ncbi:MAG: EutN/CcmL family microcompartment protein [bacterium]